MKKLSNAQIAEVLTDASTTLRAQQATIRELEEKLASKERRERVEKLASEMHRKGLELDTSANALADRLEKAASEGKLEKIEGAVELVGPDMGTKIAQLTSDEQGSSPVSSDLERFIVGGVG